MTHDGNTGLSHALDDGRTALSTFELDGLDTAFLHQTQGVVDGIVSRALIGPKGQVANKVWPLAAPSHCAAVIDDLVEGDGNGVLMALDHHAQ